jgi:hypothetical protein
LVVPSEWTSLISIHEHSVGGWLLAIFFPPDVVHSNHFSMALAGSAATRRAGRRAT